MRSLHRRGVAIAMAMLYLVLISVLAVGFATQFSTTARLTRSELDVLQTRAAAEGGIAFMRLNLPGLLTGNSEDPDTILKNVAAQLGTKLNGTANLSGHAIEQTTDANGRVVIYVPGRSTVDGLKVRNWIDLGAAVGQATVELRMNGFLLVARSTGRRSTADTNVRIVEHNFSKVREPWLNTVTGIISRSPIVMSNGTKVGGSVTSLSTKNTPPLDISGGAQIQGEYRYGTHSLASAIANGGKIQGTSARLTVNPPLPEIDPSVFESFVPSKTASGSKVITASTNISSTATLTNIRIKANANTSFGDSVTLNGVIYIESPNRITFGGGTRVKGVIVTDNNMTLPQGTNSITLNNGTRLEGPHSLNPLSFPLSERISDLIALKGSLILAPNFKVIVAGGSRSYGGTMAASEWDISNGYKGTITGSVVNLADTTFKMVGGGEVNFAATNDAAAGLYLPAIIKAIGGTYREVMQ